MVADEQDRDGRIHHGLLYLVVEPVADVEALLVDPESILNAGDRSQRLQKLGDEVLAFVAVLVRVAVADEDLSAHRRILPEKSLVFPVG